MDLREMSASEAVVWLATRTEGEWQSREANVGMLARTGAACVNHGILDTEVIEGVGYFTLKHLEDLPGGYQVPAGDLGLLTDIGAYVYTEDEENRTDWAAVAAVINTQRKALRADRSSRYGNPWREAHPAKVLTGFLAAGRGPTYARRMVDIAIRHGVRSDAHGYEIEPEVFDDLLGAGITEAALLAVYTGLGVAVSDAVALAAAGVSAPVLRAAAASGLPRTEWLDLLAGIPAEWASRVTESMHGDGPEQNARMNGGYAWTTYRRMADAGWERRSYHLGELSWGKRRRHSRVTLTEADLLAMLDADLDHDIVENYAEALTAGGGGEDGLPGPIQRFFPTGAETIRAVARVKATGIAPSNINAYRFIGCRNVEDLLRAIKAGITPAEAKRLRAEHGKRQGRFGSERTQQIANLGHAIRLHETAEKEQNVDA